METIRLEMTRMAFSSGELQYLPRGLAALMVTSSIAVADLLMYSRLCQSATQSIECIKQIEPDAFLGEIAVCQTMALTRQLCANLYNYIYLLNGGCKTEAASLPKVVEYSHGLIQEIKGHQFWELVHWYRRSAQNHYTLSEMRKLITEAPQIPGREYVFEVFTDQTPANTHYLMGEQMLVAKLKQQGDPSTVIQQFNGWLLPTIWSVMKFQNFFFAEICKNYFPDRQQNRFTVSIDKSMVGHIGQDMMPLVWTVTKRDSI